MTDLQHREELLALFHRLDKRVDRIEACFRRGEKVAWVIATILLGAAGRYLLELIRPISGG